VRYFGSSVGRDYLWIVMEYCGGGAPTAAAAQAAASGARADPRPGLLKLLVPVLLKQTLHLILLTRLLLVLLLTQLSKATLML
jgi:hypothetical protein